MIWLLPSKIIEQVQVYAASPFLLPGSNKIKPTPCFCLPQFLSLCQSLTDSVPSNFPSKPFSFEKPFFFSLSLFLSLHLISLRNVHTYMHVCVCVSMNVCAFESLMSLEYVSCTDVKMCQLLGLSELRHAKCPLLLLLLSNPRWPHACAQTSFAKHFQIQVTQILSMQFSSSSKFYVCMLLIIIIMIMKENPWVCTMNMAFLWMFDANYKLQDFICHHHHWGATGSETERGKWDLARFHSKRKLGTFINLLFNFYLFPL